MDTAELAPLTDRMRSVALRYVHDPTAAEDVVQAAMVKALRNPGAFRGEARLGTWLYRVVVTTALDHLRAAKHEATEPEPGSAPLTSASVVAWGLPSWARSPEALLRSAEAGAAICEAVAGLPRLQRRVFERADIGGEDTDTIAAAEGISAAGVRVHLHRARRRLRSVLSAFRPARVVA